MIGDWCRLALRHHWQETRVGSIQEDLRFLLAFRQEDLVIQAAASVPKGSYETENPDSDLAPAAFRLRCGDSMIEHLAREHPGETWRALDRELRDNGPRWLPRMDSTRGHNLLAGLFLRSPLPDDASPELSAWVGARFPFRAR